MADIVIAATIAALQGLPVAAGAVAYLAEPGREGNFIWRTGDFSSEVSSDPLQGLYVTAASSLPSTGAWVRDWDDIHGYPEWFGLVADDAGYASSNTTALQACLNLCPTTQLPCGDTYISGGVVITKNGTCLRGHAHTQTDQHENDGGAVSRIVCTSSTATIIQVGSSSSTNPSALTETVKLLDFTVDRNVNPFTPSTGIEGCIGISLRWCVNCHMQRVFSINSAKGWFFYGVVENYITHCGALREREGSNASNDVFIGFHLDYNAPAPYNGGNASVYIDRCRTFPLTEDGAPSLTYSSGIRMDGGWVDLWIDGFEVGAGIQYGIHGIGNGYSSVDFRGEDLYIRNCVLDPGSVACIWLEESGPQTQLHIIDNYMAAGPSGTALVLYRIGGNAVVSGNQFIVANVRTATGITANECSLVKTSGNAFTNLRSPIMFINVKFFRIEDVIHSLDSAGDYPAVSLSGTCQNGYVAPVLSGPSNCYTAGVYISPTTSRVEVNASSIEASAVPTGGKINNAGTPVTVAGSFGTNCLASGIMV